MSKVYSSVRLFSETILSVAAFLAIALFIFMSAAQKASAAEITVNSLNDTIATGDGCTLREAIANANSDNQSGSTDCAAGAGEDTISITVAGTINLLLALPDLLTDMTVTGLGASNTTVRRDDAATIEFRIFTKNSGTATISGMTIRDGISRGVTGGTTSVTGGGIFNGSGALTLSNVVVTNNQAIGASSTSGAGGRSFGGGIFTSAQLTIIGSTVSGNFSTGGSFATTGGPTAGGGIYSENAGTITITNTIISGNTATAGIGNPFGGAAFGGGIEVSGTTTMTLNNSQIVNNSAIANANSTGAGGGITVITPRAILSINNSIISGNAANPASKFGTGGGIYSTGTITITDSTLSGNAGGSGGAVNINGGGTFNLIRSTVSGNSATASSTSGGIDNASGILNVTNSTISGNVTNGTDGNNGGGIRNSIGAIIGITTLTNATITNNSAAGNNSASGVINTNGTVNVKNTIIAGDVNNATVPDVFNNAGTYGSGFVSQGYNLIGNVGAMTGFTAPGDQTGTFAAQIDPSLASLADNGGPTSTHALRSGSPAINAGDNTNATATDQRGFARIVGGTIDIGAYEFVPAKSRKRVRFF